MSENNNPNADQGPSSLDEKHSPLFLDKEATHISSMAETQDPGRDTKCEHDVHARADHDITSGSPPKNYTATHQDPNFPDGGWRAWLIIFGVCSFT